MLRFGESCHEKNVQKKKGKEKRKAPKEYSKKESPRAPLHQGPNDILTPRWEFLQRKSPYAPCEVYKVLPESTQCPIAAADVNFRIG
jgi:hypothetical protein